MKKILMYGIGSYKNRGVEAIINSTLDQMDLKNCKVSVASLDKDNEVKYLKEIKKYIPHISSKYKIEDTYIKDYQKLRTIQKELISEIPNNDILISAGGDNYSYNAGEWLYTIDREAKKQGKKLVLWGASILEKIEDYNLIEDLNLFDVLYIRESVSYDSIKNFINPKKIVLGPDPAFSLKSKKLELSPWYKDRKIVGINVSPFTININDQDKFQCIIDLIDYILNNTDYSINLIPHVIQKESNDMKLLREIKKHYKTEDRINLEKETYDCTEIKYIISQCDLLIASRTHASIAGYSQCVPTLVYGYSVKSKGIAKDLFGTYNNYVIPHQLLNNKTVIESFKWLDNNKKKIKKRLEKIMPDLIDKSSKMFKIVCDRLEENALEEICDENKCIGCGVCSKKCPHNAITMEKDELGFLHPKINMKKFTQCNTCRIMCPVLKQAKQNNYEKKVYACKVKNTEYKEQASSGGIFPLLATKFIENNKGIVYGVTKENEITKHIRIDNVEDLFRIRGSKYTQSSMLNIYNDLLDDVKKNKSILFSGTPCQIAAIKKLLPSYKNIYYVSVICHGVMSDDFVKRVLEIKDYSKDTEVKYKQKDTAWDRPNITVANDELTQRFSYDESDIMTAYLNNINLRFSCYSCQYKGDNNTADIILGDFWGIQKSHPDMYDETGVSALIVNSKNGEKLIKKNNLLEETEYEESTYDNVVSGNPALTESVSGDIERYHLKDCLEKGEIHYLVQNTRLKNQVAELEKQKQIVESERNLALLHKETLEESLNSILNSKRWKYVDRVLNVVRKNK